METASESAEPLRDDGLALPGFEELEISGSGATALDRPLWRARTRTRVRARLDVAVRQELLWIAVIYIAARILLLVAAYVQGRFGHNPFQNELTNWDGFWYRELANKGYPAHVSYGQTTLGFFPLFPISIWAVEHVLLPLSPSHLILFSSIAGVIVSGAGGLIATILVHRLAEGWWDRDTARRATILFVLFPGAVVFSMVYSEGLLMPLALGCIYALERRRWLLAGILAGFGTAVQPVGLMLAPVCLVAAVLEIRRRGWRAREGYRSLVAPILSVTGMAGFMLFLWLWTGTPFANYIAQHHGWSESTSLLALVHVAQKLGNQVSFSHFDEPTINLNYVIGLLGAVILTIELVLVWFRRREISVPALVWTALISFLAFTSSNVPPNPRMLITAFPALIVIARYARGRWFRVIAWVNGGLFVGLSLLTFYGLTLRP
ncbi:MAG TPA: mannosyltransferase family protein [Solirubrobacteraceae bacterium]|nr:mannosyltransferase family protein [Solirubrobacteraceae bacterium]